MSSRNTNKKVSPQQVRLAEDESKQQPNIDPNVLKQHQQKDRQHQQTLQQTVPIDTTKQQQQQQQQQTTKRTSPQQQVNTKQTQQTRPNVTTNAIQDAKLRHTNDSTARARTMTVNNYYRSLIRQGPHHISWQHSTNRELPLPKTLLQFLENVDNTTHNLLHSLDQKHANFASYLNGRVLSRHPDTLRFEWFVPPALQPNALFYHDVNNINTHREGAVVADTTAGTTTTKQATTGTTTATTTATRRDRRTVEQDQLHCREIWRNHICQEIQNTNKTRLLHKWYPNKQELALKMLQHDYFKLLRIVCDSYTMLHAMICATTTTTTTTTNGNNKQQPQKNVTTNTPTCDESALPLPLHRNICNIPIKRGCDVKVTNKTPTTTTNNNKKVTPTTKPTTNATNTNTTPTTFKSAFPTKECIQQCQYDETALANLCTKTHFPTPLSISLHRDYRAPRVSWRPNGAVHICNLDQAINAVLKNGLLYKLAKYPSRLAQRIQLRDFATLHLNDLCPHYDDCLAKNVERRGEGAVKTNGNGKGKQQAAATTTTQQQQQQQQQPIDWEKRLGWVNKLEKVLNGTELATPTTFNKTTTNKRFNALSSLRPIDLWALRTFIAQTKECYKLCNPKTNPQCVCDIRQNKVQFAKDLADMSKKISYTFQRSADRNYTTACNNHQQCCERLHKSQFKLQHMLSTTVPWSAFFTNPTLVTQLQKGKMTLQPLLPVWVQFQEWLVNNNAWNVNSLLSLLSRAVNNTAKQQQRGDNKQRTRTTADKKQQPQQPIEPYKLDKAGRKCSTIVTPTALKAAKRSLHHVFNYNKDINNLFHHLQRNPFIGHVMGGNAAADVGRSSRGILDTVLGLFRKKSY